MKNRKTKTFIFKGFGFPIKLIDAPMKKMAGEWVIDIDMNRFQIFILRILIAKTSPLTKNELRFIRKYLSMTTTEFGNLFGMTHTAVSQWETGARKISPTLELCIRLCVFDHLHPKDSEFRRIYKEINLRKLSEFEKASVRSLPLAVEMAEDFKIA